MFNWLRLSKRVTWNHPQVCPGTIWWVPRISLHPGGSTNNPVGSQRWTSGKSGSDFAHTSARLTYPGDELLGTVTGEEEYLELWNFNLNSRLRSLSVVNFRHIYICNILCVYRCCEFSEAETHQRTQYQSCIKIWKSEEGTAEDCYGCSSPHEIVP